MSRIKEIESLVFLLDDNDPEISDHVRHKLLSYGEEIVPVLEDIYIRSEIDIRNKLDDIIELLQNRNLISELEGWAQSGGKDLFQGLLLVNRTAYPNLSENEISGRIDKIKLDAWLELHNSRSPIDQIRILNHVVYQLHKFSGSPANRNNPDSFLLNRVLELKSGSPAGIGVLYCLIAQRLNIPIFGINLPHHFILAYKELSNKPDQDSLPNQHELMNPQAEGEVLFYINPVNNGTIFSKWNIDKFIKELNIAPKSAYYEPCSNIDIILRLLSNLAGIYDKKSRFTKVKYINSLIATIQPFAE